MQQPACTSPPLFYSLNKLNRFSPSTTGTIHKYSPESHKILSYGQDKAAMGTTVGAVRTRSTIWVGGICLGFVLLSKGGQHRNTGTESRSSER